MTLRRTFAFLVACLIAFALGAASMALYATAHRPVFDSALGCVDTVVTEAHDPTGDAMVDGGSITFHDIIDAKDEVTGVYIPPGDYAVASAGDRARVCLISIHTKDDRCDPDKDTRGRLFLVYDLAKNDAEVYSNGEHGCGGA
jgi:hypothetical protein